MAATGSGNVEFIRARSDKREYRRVALANALEVLVISDPDADKVCRSVAISGRPPFGMVANLSLSLCSGGGVHGGRGGLVQRPGGARGPRALAR